MQDRTGDEGKPGKPPRKAQDDSWATTDPLEQSFQTVLSPSDHRSHSSFKTDSYFIAQCYTAITPLSVVLFS